MSHQSIRSISAAVFMLVSICSTAQITNMTPRLTEGNIYALIIGISEYQDSSIADLRFAHRDAEAFADFLASPAGGNVPAANISFLTNDQATISNIYMAKRNLENKASAGDLVYFYFSGHGAVEEGLYSLGFLLAYDTPHKNYLTNAIRIEDINMMANSLSVSRDAEVVLITDACHSGRLTSSDNRSNMLIGDQLSKSQNNEARLASCEPDQLSQEGEAWGGGRGVFSYYLINGMKGLADDREDRDGIITLGELKVYLEQKVPKDVERVKMSDQVPVLTGKSRKTLAIVDEEALNTIELQVDLEKSGDIASRSIGYTPSAEDRYFSNLSKLDLRETIDWEAWHELSEKKIIKNAIKIFKACETNDIKKSTWRKQLKKDKEAQIAYGQRLAAAIHNSIQPVVNAYMDGKVELINQQQIDEATATLIQCQTMLEVAHKLIKDDNYLYKIIGVKKHYLAVLELYIQIPYSENPEKLQKEAKEHLDKAMSYESKAAYLRFTMTFESTKSRSKTDTSLQPPSKFKNN